MLENETDDKFSNRQSPETVDGQTEQGQVFLRIRRLQLKKKRGDTLLKVDMGLDMPTEPPAIVRLPIQTAWYAIRLAVCALGFELVIDRED